VVFFLAGYETTANTLSSTVYHLAKNPQIQEELFEELDQADGELDQETINDLVYLDAVISEDLRMSPPVTIHDRICVKDCQVSPDLFIKKGTRIDLPIWVI